MATSNLPDAANQQVRAVLIERIRALLAANDWPQEEAAGLCVQTQPRTSNLWRGAALFTRFSGQYHRRNGAALDNNRRGSMEYTEADAEHLVAELMAKLAAKPVKGRYLAATESSRTQSGGQAVATSGLSTIGSRVALVEDIVRYPDGSQAHIVSGAGNAMRYVDRAIGLVGCTLDHGDTINGLEQSGMVIVQYADEPPIPGLLEPAPGAASSGEAP